MTTDLLSVKNLVTAFRTSDGELSAVRGVSFSVKKGETLCIVGESGCGKSITSLSVMGLLPSNGYIKEGMIDFEGRDLAKLSQEKLRSVRGKDISMIFQEPMTALNPVLTIGYQLREPLMLHHQLSKSKAHKEGIELLKQVGIPYPEKRMKQYPHELSGGMRQRVMIAISLACHPRLLIADEPTTALDVTIQAQILDLIQDLKDKLGMGVIMVTHDMGVVAEVANRVMVMYAGEKVEEGTVESIFNSPQHPYTRGLLNSVPNIDEPDFELEAIPGSLPNLNEDISGCRFHPRCPFATERCAVEKPREFEVGKDHKVKCWLQEVEEDANSRPSIVHS
ncbi:peptide/nickel transport system ATP-binding protein/oligopeptide transport system ATP-binding protein [Bacillus pakistanensis]|uniref:Peptide/nickel transport system ATP-binding protein/oligopeptide transport system ATP-binding protein n=1 Tax=Rossellomorea pakistanensis TaxID=992288 RepID=A0ABS2NE98_9BACI|nr:ABC transporter ATP-binding protein [Bacillus pakistanensis]MBM7585896.1 peptide/nickel transport system ATP-binding protein/oligopeptide transport system ATP-binding protein [Bacillus pakistanensis]